MLKNLSWKHKLNLSPAVASGSGPSAAFAAAAANAGIPKGESKEPPPEALEGDFGGEADVVDDPPEATPPAEEMPASVAGEVNDETRKAIDLGEEDDTLPPAKVIDPGTGLEVEAPPAAEKAKVPTLEDLFDDPEDLKFAREMSNPAKKHFGSRLKALREGIDPKPATFFDHPQGYVLLPEYGDQLKQLNKVKSEQEFWQKQLSLIEDGENFKVIEGVDEQGNPVISEKSYKPTGTAKVAINNALMEISSDLKTTSEKLTSIREGFGGSFKDAQKVIDEERTKRFPWVAKPEMEEKVTITLNDYGTQPIKKVKTDFIGMLPKVWQNHPMAKGWADTFIALQLNVSRVQGLLQEIEKLKNLAGDQSRAEPLVRTGGGKVKEPTFRGGPAEFSDDDMP